MVALSFQDKNRLVLSTDLLVTFNISIIEVSYSDRISKKKKKKKKFISVGKINSAKIID